MRVTAIIAICPTAFLAVITAATFASAEFEHSDIAGASNNLCGHSATVASETGRLRSCETLTATIGVTICIEPALHLVFVLPETAPDSAWLSAEAFGVLQELESASGLERSVGVAEFGSVIRRRLELTSDLSLARRYLGDRPTGFVAFGAPEGIKTGHEILRSGRTTVGDSAEEVVVLFLTWKQLWLSRRDEAARVIDAIEDLLADGAIVLVACPAEGSDRCGGTREIASTLGIPYFDTSDRLKVARFVKDELARAASSRWESQVGIDFPVGLEYVDGSATKPADVRMSPMGTHLSWFSGGAGSRASEMISFELRGAQEGTHSISGSLVVTTGVTVLVPVGPMTVTVHGSVCDVSTPSATPTPTRAPTVTPTPAVPAPLYLPLILKEYCTPETSYADTILVVDASSSMLDEVSRGYTKRDAAVDAAGRFVKLLKPGDQVGVVWFNETVGLAQELTGDKVALLSALDGIENRQYTRIDLGIKMAREELATDRHLPDNQPVIILLTDGKSNPEPIESAVAEAGLAKGGGVTLFVIGLGNPEDLDDEALRLIASRPEYYFRIADAAALAAIYEEIAGVIPCPPERFWGRRTLRRLPTHAFP